MQSLAPFRQSLARLRTSAPFAARTFSSTPTQRLARFNLIGRLGNSPEVVTTSTGREIVRYSVGTSSGSAENKTTSWWNVAFFGDKERKDYVLNIPKGSLIYVEAEARMRKVERDGGSVDNVLSLTQARIELLRKPMSSYNPKPEEQNAPANEAPTEAPSS